MVKWENPELTSSHGSIYRATMNKNLQSSYRQEQSEDQTISRATIKITTIYRATINKNNLKISRTDIKKKLKKRWIGAAETWYNQDTHMQATHKGKEYDNHTSPPH